MDILFAPIDPKSELERLARELAELEEARYDILARMADELIRNGEYIHAGLIRHHINDHLEMRARSRS